MSDLTQLAEGTPPLRLAQFDYELPTSQIAQTPLVERDQSRLMTLDRKTGALGHRRFADLPDLLQPGDVLVVNDTRVTALRLFGARRGHPDERVETFLTHRKTDDIWESLVRPGRKLLPGTVVEYGNGLTSEVLQRTDARGGRLLQMRLSMPGRSVDDVLADLGQAPLPPYITTALPPEARERYQTIYSQHGGSAAAPTAGLHFTSALLERIAERGVRIARVTLHVGLGTFRPIETEDVMAHTMHAERIVVSTQAADIVNSAVGRIVAVGTTSARTLESAAIGSHRIEATDRETDLYITPGYRFQIIDALITNFHMPRSTLFVLVSALAGTAHVQRAYAAAIDDGYRFLSFGDAMMIA